MTQVRWSKGMQHDTYGAFSPDKATCMSYILRARERLNRNDC